MILHVTSHPTTWSIAMAFDDDGKCAAASELLVKAKNEARHSKMFQIYISARTHHAHTRSRCLFLEFVSTQCLARKTKRKTRATAPTERKTPTNQKTTE